MCKIDSDIRLCSCVDLNNLKEEDYVWKLEKYVEYKSSRMLGICLLPKNELDNKLSDEYVVRKLNEKKIFDFEYFPNEGDYLIIEKANRKNRIEREYLYGDFMCFIFTSGKWVIKRYDPFSNITEEFKNGIVKFDK